MWRCFRDGENDFPPPNRSVKQVVTGDRYSLKWVVKFWFVGPKSQLRGDNLVVSESLEKTPSAPLHRYRARANNPTAHSHYQSGDPADAIFFRHTLSAGALPATVYRQTDAGRVPARQHPARTARTA